MRVLVIAFALGYCTQLFAQTPHDDGIAVGHAANAAIGAMIDEHSASSVVPGYSAQPREASYYGTDLNSPSSALISFCQTAPSDPNCAAINSARASALAPHPPPPSASVTGVEDVTANPEAILGKVSGAYSACKTTQTLVSPPVFETETCNNFYTALQGEQCTRTLAVQVEWICPPGSTSGPTRAVDPVTRTGKWICIKPEPKEAPSCGTGLTGPYASTATFPGSQVCLDVATGVEQLASTVTSLVATELAATPRETDLWENQCASYEKSVAATQNACRRTRTQCSDGPATKLINDASVTRACWAATDSYDCVFPDPASDCNRPVAANCTQVSAPTCIDWEPAFTPPVCIAEQIDFSCKIKEAVHQTLTDCETQTFCAGGECWNTGYPPDADFARTAALLEAQREAGVYLDHDNLTVFNGTAGKCRVKFSGVSNCCQRSGGGERMNNNMIARGLLDGAGSLVGESAEVVGSTYMYDALFSSDAPDWMLNAYSAMFGSGSSTVFNPGMSFGLYGVTLSLGGTIPAGATALWSSASGTTVLYFNPATFYIAIAILVIQELLECEQEEQVLGLKRGQQLCVKLGSYCSKRVLGSCLTRTESHCCFNSRLARLINTQGRALLGKGWGSPRNPDCSGFTVEQLQAMDFSRMDLSEFYAKIAPTLPDAAALATKVQKSVTTKATPRPAAP